MKILHLDSGGEMRGGQWQVLRLHQALIESGHESFLLAREGGRLLTIAGQRGLPCEALRPFRLLMRSQGFDLLHAHDARSHSLAALISRVPLVVSRRVAFPVGTSGASRWKYGRPRRFLAVSRFVAGILIEAGIGPDRIDVVYDGVEVPAAPAEGEAIVTPYTVDPAKGMTLAEKAAALAGLPLVCSKDLEHDLVHARAMVYLTQSEGLGSGILLAMAYGVAVVASRTGGIPELIEDGVTGILVENDPRTIANALRSLSPQRCAVLGRAARETVQQRFTLAHMLAATLTSYQKALND
jgi:glycosyltransferase involved in cell wall biosynthesis